MCFHRKTCLLKKWLPGSIKFFHLIIQKAKFWICGILKRELTSWTTSSACHLTQKHLIVSPSGLSTTRGQWLKGRNTSCSVTSRTLLRFSTSPWGGTGAPLKCTITPSPTSRLPHLSKCPPSWSSRRPKRRTELSTGASLCWSWDQRDHSHLQLWLLSLSTCLSTVSRKAVCQTHHVRRCFSMSFLFSFSSLQVPPTFLNPEPEVLYLQPGDETTLNCTATGNPAPMYTWQSSQPIQGGLENVAAITSNSLLPGTYICTASNTLQKKIKKFTLRPKSKGRQELMMYLSTLLSLILCVIIIVFVCFYSGV